jgi:hypothetical protein
MLELMLLLRQKFRTFLESETYFDFEKNTGFCFFFQKLSLFFLKPNQIIFFKFGKSTMYLPCCKGCTTPLLSPYAYSPLL